MPGRDRTGPVGMGPLTGRGMGFCAGMTNPADAESAPPPCGGAGFGRGLGFGGGRRGRRNMFYATGLPGWMRAGAGAPAAGIEKPADRTEGAIREQNMEVLKMRAERLEEMMQDIQARLKSIETLTAEKSE